MKLIVGPIALALMLSASAGRAQGFPTHPIHIIVPFSPGTSGDLVSRLVAEELKASLQQPVLIENRVGASGRVGVGSLARAPADGYTIGMGNESTHLTIPLLNGRTAYDPVRDFTPLTLAVRTTMAIAVNPSVLPVATLPELIALARTRSIPFGSPADGSPQHLIGKLLAQRSGGQFEHVERAGAADTAGELAEGRLPMAISTLSSLLEHPGKLRILAIGDAARRADLPNVPTLGETWPDLVVTGWLAYFAPAQVPPEVAARLSAALQAALRKPVVALALRQRALEPASGPAEELGQLMRSGLDAWGPLLRKMPD